ncbi:MAG TPA: N-acetyltransferase [Candidatus Dormibacteraeota bacterium]|nr:N-acetyltransferase [Candidatus Dormibacteraeota bacterium]
MKAAASWVVREERPEDHDEVRRVESAAFAHQAERVARLVDALREGLSVSNGLSLVATESDVVVGHAMFTHSLLDAPQRLVEVQVLSPIGVLPERQRQGIGSMLIRRGLGMLNARGVPLVFLEGSPDYYRRFGFVAAAQLDFRKPSLRIPDAAFQVKVLDAYEPWMTGTFVYSQTFWDLDLVGLRETPSPPPQL